MRRRCVFLLGHLRWSPVVTVFVFVRFSLGAPVHQLPDHDRDGGPPGTRENLHLHEAHLNWIGVKTKGIGCQRGAKLTHQAVATQMETHLLV